MSPAFACGNLRWLSSRHPIQYLRHSPSRLWLRATWRGQDQMTASPPFHWTRISRRVGVNISCVIGAPCKTRYSSSQTDPNHTPFLFLHYCTNLKASQTPRHAHSSLSSDYPKHNLPTNGCVPGSWGAWGTYNQSACFPKSSQKTIREAQKCWFESLFLITP